MSIRTPFPDRIPQAIAANASRRAACARVIIRAFPRLPTRLLAVTLFLTMVPAHSNASVVDDEKTVAALDTEYQAAVGKNDATRMDRILADDFVLVTGRGVSHTKGDLLWEARSKKVIYEHQEDSQQKVRVWGDTAVVTALLWAKGVEEGKSFDYKLWFSDVYVRAPTGWRYVFGQASLPLPKEQPK